MFSKAYIKKQLKRFNIAKGKVVTIHTSLKAIGEIEGGAEDLLTVLIEYFTEQGGLLCVPTHTWKFAVYDMNKIETYVGVLPNIAAGHPDGVRSAHLTHSVIVFGKKDKAEEFVKNDAFTNTLTSPKCCYGKIYNEDCYVLLIGVGHDKNTYLHCVEEMIGNPNRIANTMTETTIIHKGSREEKRLIYWFNNPEVSKNYGKFEPAFRYHNCIVDGYIGNAHTQLCNARKMKEIVELIYKNNNCKELLDNSIPLDDKLYK